MKLTTAELKQIIAEELATVLDQGRFELSVKEGKFEENPKFAEEMQALGQDLGNLIPMLRRKNPKEAERLGLPTLGVEFRATASGATEPCTLSARLEDIIRSFGLNIGQAQPGLDNWLRAYPACLKEEKKPSEASLKKAEKSMRKTAKEKFPGDKERQDRYVYGGKRNMGWKPKSEK